MMSKANFTLAIAGLALLLSIFNAATTRTLPTNFVADNIEISPAAGWQTIDRKCNFVGVCQARR